MDKHPPLFAYTHRHGDAVSRSTEGGRVTLVNNNTEFLDASRSVTAEVDVGDGSVGSIGLGLDAERLVVVDNLVIQDLDVGDGSASGDRADGDAVPARAGVALEDDVGALVEREAVVLVVDGAVLDGEVRGRDVETITTERGEFQPVEA